MSAAEKPPSMATAADELRTELTIAHVISGLGRGGAENTLYNLVVGLKAKHIHSTVISLTGPGSYSSKLRSEGIKVIELSMKSPVGILSGVGNLSRFIGQLEPDIVQTWMYHADLLGTIAAVRAGASPIVWNIRGSGRSWRELGSGTWITRWACRLISSMADVAVANSGQGMLDHRKYGYRPRQWRVIFNGVDTELFRPRPEARRWLRERVGFPTSAIVLGYVARYHPLKRHSLLLKAIAPILNRDPNVHLVMIGEGVGEANQELRALLGETVNRDRIRLVGSQDEIPKWMAGLDLHVLASASEGFPNVVAEAMACGVPNVVTDVGEARQLVGSTGFVVQPDEPSALTAGILELLELDDPVRAELGTRARARIIEHFSLEKMIAEYGSLYRGLKSERAPLD